MFKIKMGFGSIQYIERHFLGCFVCRIQALPLLPFKSNKPAFSPVLVFLRVV